MDEPNKSILGQDFQSQTGEIERLHTKLREVTTYVHELHLAREDDRLRLQEVRRDIEQFISWLETAEAEKQSMRSRLEGWEVMHRSGFFGRVRHLLGHRPKVLAIPPALVGTQGKAFRYYLKTSPFRVFRNPTFTLEGWLLPEDETIVTGLRALVDDEAFFGTYGVEEPRLPEWHGIQRNNPNPGFKIIIETPPGRRRLRLEAQLGADQWFSVLTTPIWVKPD